MSTTSTMESRVRRSRIEQTNVDEYNMDDDDYEPYIPIAQRKQAKFNALVSSSRPSQSSRRAQLEAAEENEEELEEEERQRENARIERTLLMEAQEVHERKAAEGAFVVCSQLSRGLTTLTFRCEKD